MARSPEFSFYRASEQRELPQRQGVLLILAGPTGSGKTEVLKGLIDQNSSMRRVVSTTTRAPRVEKGEQHGVDYYFSDPNTFQREKEQGEFLETEEYGGGDWYGTKKEDIEPVLSGSDVGWIVNMAKARRIDETFQEMYDPVTAQSFMDRTLVVLVGIPSMRELYRRYEERGGGTFEKFKLRVREDLDVWNNHQEDFPHVVINKNGKLEETIDEVKRLIEEKRTQLTEGDGIAS